MCATEATSAVVTHGRAGEGRYTFVGLSPSLVSRSKQEELMRTKVLGCSVCQQEAGGLAVEAVVSCVVEHEFVSTAVLSLLCCVFSCVGQCVHYVW